MVNSRESVPERHRPRHCGARPGAAARGPPNPFRGLATAMLALAVCAGRSCRSGRTARPATAPLRILGRRRDTGAWRHRPRRDRCGDPSPAGRRTGQRPLSPARSSSFHGGPEERSLYGGSLGIVYRFEGAGGIVGVNAFHDLNRISGPGRAMTHRQASLGADYQSGRSRIGRELGT